MTIYNKTSAPILDVYKPAKVLQCSVTSATGEQTWPYNDGEGDPWWGGSDSPKFFQYSITFTVAEYSHGSHKTREAKKYNGLDVSVGDWIAGSQDGKCMQIISVTAKSSTSVTCVIEDVLRYNTFRSATGSPIFSIPGTAILFTVNESGKPLLDPLPASVVSSDFFPNVLSRFEYFNPTENFRLEKTSHTFARGDVIAITESGEFVRANAVTVARTIGVVSTLGPGPNQFMIKPQNRIIDFNPELPGTAGSYIYADVDGDLTTDDTTGKVLFLKLKDSILSSVTSGNADAVANAADIIEINGVDITLTGGNTGVVAVDINSETANTNVYANLTPSPTTVVSNSDTYAYGLVGGFIPFSANIDSGNGNTTVLINSATSGAAVYGPGIADANDIRDAINSAGIPNLEAIVLGGGEIQISESSGNAVNIYNVTGDTNSTPFGGTGSITGLTLETSATSGQFLTLSRDDGGPIDLENKTGTPADDLSIYSVHNGQFPLGLYIEHGVRTGGVTVVADINARNSLSSQGGDMAYVQSADDGEWALFLFDGASWVEVGNQDSADTDAQTLTYKYTSPGGGFGGVETIELGNISPGCRIIDVAINCITPLTNYQGASLPGVEVGTSSDLNQFIDVDSSDLSARGFYTVDSGYTYPSSQQTDLALKARIYHRTATLGEFDIVVTYI